MKSNFNAQKTAIALAVAGLLAAGSVYAADYTVQQGGHFTNTDNKVTIDKVVDEQGKAVDSADSIKGTDTLTLDNGSLNVISNEATVSGTLAGVFGVGDINLVATNTTGATTPVNVATTLTLTSGNTDKGAQGSNLTFNLTSKVQGDQKGEVTLNLVDGMLGGEHSEIVVVSDANTNATIASTDSQDLVLTNVTLQNAGLLALESDGTAIKFQSSYDNTNAGKLTTNKAFELTGGNSFTTTTAVIGTSDTAKTVFGNDVTIGEAGSGTPTAYDVFTAESLEINSANTFTVEHTGKSNIGAFTVKAGNVALGGENTIGTLTVLTENNTVTGETTVTGAFRIGQDTSNTKE